MLNFDGKIKQEVTSFIKKIPYRFLSTATPSPNDFIELGTSSEALGYLGYMDMLQGKFFKTITSIEVQTEILVKILFKTTRRKRLFCNGLINGLLWQ
jgi:hypothetical protein